MINAHKSANIKFKMFYSANYLSAAFLKINQLSNIQTYKYAKCFILPIINLLRFYIIYKHTNMLNTKSQM